MPAPSPPSQANWSRLKHVPAVVEALKNTPFVISGPPLAAAAAAAAAAGAAAGASTVSGVSGGGGAVASTISALPLPASSSPPRQCPSSLLDPASALHSQVFSRRPDRFPAGEFDSWRWLPLLRDVGLQREMTPQLYLECAREVERSYVESLGGGREGARGSGNGGVTGGRLLSGSGAAAASSFSVPMDAGGISGALPAIAAVLPSGSRSSGISAGMSSSYDKGDGGVSGPAALADDLLFEDLDLGSGDNAIHTSSGNASGAASLLWEGEGAGGGLERGSECARVMDKALWQAAVALAESFVRDISVLFGSSAMEEMGKIR